MPTRSVTVPGGRLHVIDEGPPDAPPVLLLHAGIVDSRSWDEVVPHLTAAGYRVIRYDQRGFGATETDDVAYSNRADAVAVLDALEVERAVMVGNSRGGAIAIDTALEFPDRVVAIIGVAADVSGLDGDLPPEEIAAFDRLEALEEAVDEAGADADPAQVAELVEGELRVWVDGLGQPEGRLPAAIREAFRRMDTEHYGPGRVQGRPQPLEPRAATRMGDLRLPILAIAGELDISAFPDTARLLEASAPNARAVIWPDVAHVIPMEQPARLAAEIVGFVAQVPSWR